MSNKYTEIPTLLIQSNWKYVKHVGQPWNYMKTSYFFLQGFDLQIDTLNYDFELQPNSN